MKEAVHMVMGVEEANVIGVALQLLSAKIGSDIERWEDKGEKAQNEFMAMLSVKFATENMISSIEGLLEESEHEHE